MNNLRTLSSEEQEALHLLALRKKHYRQYYNYVQSKWWFTLSSYKYICLICDEEILGVIYDHGLNHLKEYNLLPFI